VSCALHDRIPKFHYRHKNVRPHLQRTFPLLIPVNPLIPETFPPVINSSSDWVFINFLLVFVPLSLLRHSSPLDIPARFWGPLFNHLLDHAGTPSFKWRLKFALKTLYPSPIRSRSPILQSPFSSFVARSYSEPGVILSHAFRNACNGILNELVFGENSTTTIIPLHCPFEKRSWVIEEPKASVII